MMNIRENGYTLRSKVRTKEIKIHRNECTTNTNITDKDEVPDGDLADGTYSDEKLIQIIDQSLEYMDKDRDGYISFPEFVSVQEAMKKSSGH